MSLFSSQKKVRLGRGVFGKGLFTDEAVLDGEFIIDYCRELVPKVESDRRERDYTKCGLSNEYILAISYTSDVIDASFYGNRARFINHNCEPNCRYVTELLSDYNRGG